MKPDKSLAAKRDEFGRQMAGYRSLPEYLLDSLGAVLQRLTSPKKFRERSFFLPLNASEQEQESFPSYLLTGILVALFTFLVGWAVSALSGYRPSADEFKLMAWSAFSGALALVVNKINIRAFLNTFRHSCVDRMLRVADIEALEKWLRRNFNSMLPVYLILGLGGGPFLGWFLYSNWLFNHSATAVFRIGPFVTIVLACIQAVWVAIYLYPFYVAFPSILNRYHFDLYTLDPSSSEVVGQLSRLLTFILYATMAYIVQLTLGLSYVEVLTAKTPVSGFIFSVFIWAPTVILYAAGQFHLSGIILRAKWRTLNEVQAKIEELNRAGKIPDKDTLERLDKLMNYHDRIRDTPNSALNFRAGLNFLNSLLLPVIAFVVANFKDVIAFLK
jgi:hypothetical protein